MLDLLMEKLDIAAIIILKKQNSELSTFIDQSFMKIE